MKLKDYFNIPNCLGYLRIILLPVFMVLYLKAETTKDFIIAYAVIIFSMSTDVFDGMIARKFNMVTEFGKALDPIADKLTQLFLTLTLLFKYKLMKVFVVCFVIKELYMGIMGLYLLKLGKGIIAAKWFGKLATVLINTGTVSMFVFPHMPIGIVNAIIIVMTVATVGAGIGYGIMHYQTLKEVKES